MKNRDKLLLLGTGLVAFGLVMFFMNTRLISVGFYRFGQVSTGGILIALVLLDVILLFALRHKAFKILLPILLALIVLSVILGSQIYFSGKVIDLLLMLVPAAAGAGLLLRAAFMKKE